MQDALLRTVFQILTVLYFLIFALIVIFSIVKILDFLLLDPYCLFSSIGERVALFFLSFFSLLFIVTTFFCVNLYHSFEPFKMFWDFCWNGGAWFG